MIEETKEELKKKLEEAKILLKQKDDDIMKLKNGYHNNILSLSNIYDEECRARAKTIIWDEKKEEDAYYNRIRLLK